MNFAAGGVAKTCSIGSSPVYTVDATSAADVIKGVNFARQKNIRLVIRNTGHDITGRSTGYGSLEVWIRHLRQGITFQKKFVASDKCSKCAWSGSAIKIAGGYVWRDVYAVANKENVIVVGGGDPVRSRISLIPLNNYLHTNRVLDASAAGLKEGATHLHHATSVLALTKSLKPR